MFCILFTLPLPPPPPLSSLPQTRNHRMQFCFSLAHIPSQLIEGILATYYFAEYSLMYVGFTSRSKSFTDVVPAVRLTTQDEGGTRQEGCMQVCRDAVQGSEELVLLRVHVRTRQLYAQHDILTLCGRRVLVAHP